jgi:imidazolonepropionase
VSELAIVNARVVTMAGAPIPLGTVRVRGGAIASVEAQAERVDARGGEMDARGRVLMPAFVDCHTHAMWAGDRLDEFDLKLRGATYLEILKSGGGIMSTVRAVRAASETELAANLIERLRVMASEGTLTVEVKSGYGLTTRDELKMLRAIARAAEAARGFGVTVVPTALIAHAVDLEQSDFIERTVGETLDAVHAEFPSVAIDAYCEEGAWSFEECRRLFERAMELGHPCRVHADQFNALGMTSWAAERGFVSVDHLEATGAEELSRLARSGTFGVMLPCSGFQVDDRYADGRALVDAGGAPVIATNCNPGSAPTSSMPFAVALATRKLGLTVDEALAACTVNAARVLGFEDRGVIAAGKRADLILLRHTDERMLAYEFGGDPVESVFHA